MNVHGTVTVSTVCEEGNYSRAEKERPDPFFFPALRIHTRNDHGTGCALATAIASGLAMGLGLSETVASGCAFVHAALQRSAQLRNGSGRGSMDLLDLASR